MIVPPVRGRLKFISIGNFLDDNAPVMWRGPMLHRALEQFLCDVHWGELDTIVVDMPPGTGDIAISLGQLLPRAEVLIVTTPQPLAQEVAARAAMMAQKTGQKLLGVVENMSGDAFGTGGGCELADDLGVPLLGRCRSTRRCGRPVTRACRWSSPIRTSESARAIVAIAEAVSRRGRARSASRSPSSPRTAEGARRRPPQSASLVVLAALVHLHERPSPSDLGTGHLDPVASLRSGSAFRSPIVQACEAPPSDLTEIEEEVSASTWPRTVRNTLGRVACRRRSRRGSGAAPRSCRYRCRAGHR